MDYCYQMHYSHYYIFIRNNIVIIFPIIMLIVQYI